MKKEERTCRLEYLTCPTRDKGVVHLRLAWGRGRREVSFPTRPQRLSPSSPLSKGPDDGFEKFPENDALLFSRSSVQVPICFFRKVMCSRSFNIICRSHGGPSMVAVLNQLTRPFFLIYISNCLVFLPDDSGEKDGVWGVFLLIQRRASLSPSIDCPSYANYGSTKTKLGYWGTGRTHTTSRTDVLSSFIFCASRQTPASKPPLSSNGLNISDLTLTSSPAGSFHCHCLLFISVVVVWFRLETPEPPSGYSFIGQENGFGVAISQAFLD